MRQLVSLSLIFLLSHYTLAGLLIRKGDGVRFTGADGVEYVGVNGIRFTGADGLLGAELNGVRFTGADGTRFTGADGVRFTGADGITYTGTNGVRFTGADSITLASADSVRIIAPNGARFTGADGVVYQANTILLTEPRGIRLTRTNGIVFIGVDGLRFTGADADFNKADGGRIRSTDAVRFTGADVAIGFNSEGVIFNLRFPQNFSITSLDENSKIEIIITKPESGLFTGIGEYTITDELYEAVSTGLQSFDPDLAVKLNELTDDSSINAVIVFHNYPSEEDLQSLINIGILGGTLYKILPMIAVSTTKAKIIQASRLPNVRSIYGNRTLNFDNDPYLRPIQISRLASDRFLLQRNGGTPVSGKNITVAVLDTGVNGLHSDLAGRVVQNVKLLDNQSIGVGFINPRPVENLPNTDPISGHGTFVAGIIAGNGASSGGRYKGVAPSARILGLSAGELSLFHVLSGFDYVLEKGAVYNVKVINCSFSSDSVFDFNDPVNIATKMLVEKGISVVFSAGNTGPSNATLNPYAVAPWVISVGATDQFGKLASFSSRGVFGSRLFRPSLVAPGVNLISLRSTTSQTGILGIGIGADTQRLAPLEIPFYTTASGTSFSAPQVAGTIALMLEVNPSLTPAQIKDILQRSATPLPLNYAHEVGAGMLNTYAAVLEAANPALRMGAFRSSLDQNVTFVSSNTEIFDSVVTPGETSVTEITLPANITQINVSVNWANPLNDLNLKIYDENNNLVGISDRINLPIITGKVEKVTIQNPSFSRIKIAVSHSSGIGVTENYSIVISFTYPQTPQITDISSISPGDLPFVLESLQKLCIELNANEFKPNLKVSKGELAESMLRCGVVPQYLAPAPIYQDASDLIGRTAVESVQFSPYGKLMPDINNSRFGYFEPATKLILAVALVKASNMEDQAASLTLSPTVTDRFSIPAAYRGHVAFALQKGWLSLENNQFNPNRAIGRAELAKAIIRFLKT
ncbi:MAG: S8 family serine peptidase [Pyrinomonadaceae bacterium]|nr:S8 family serine peptidase [Pyrinomonadaceae bacterium]